MPTRHERKAQRQAKMHKQRLLNIMVISLAVVAVIAVVIIILTQQVTPIPTSGVTLGNPDAPIKITEFADFQCPACAYFVKTIKPELVEKYIRTGKVSFSFSPYSFIGPESYAAAEAAYCAADQDKFWLYYDYLFSHQGAENSGTFSSANLAFFAQQLGLDTTIFSQCIDSHKYQNTVKDANNVAQSYGLSGTPSFVVNGKVVSSQTDLIPAIENLLNP